MSRESIATDVILAEFISETAVRGELARRRLRKARATVTNPVSALWARRVAAERDASGRRRQLSAAHG